MTQNNRIKEGRRSGVCAAFVSRLYGLNRSPGLRAMLRRLVLKTEGGAMYSLTVRELYRRFHDLEVGLYTIGPCEAGPYNFDPGTKIGRYSSIYYTVRTITRDYQSELNSGHGLFFDSALTGERAARGTAPHLVIGNDVFIGHNAVILPSTERIGDGAIIGAGSVVQSPIPPYAILTGNPARVVRYRFSPGTIEELLASKWWLKGLDELRGEIEEFRRPLEGETVR